jgi:transcriptional regulator with GAF, ATPase, and Fis domain
MKRIAKPAHNKVEDYEALLLLSSNLVKATTKKELMSILKEEIASLFQFHYCTICLLTDDKEHFRTYLLDQDSKLNEIDNSYEESLQSGHSIKEGVFLQVLQSEVPLHFDLQAMKADQSLPQILHFTYEIGIRQMIGISLFNNGEKYGTLTFYTEETEPITAVELKIAGIVAGQVSIALFNILARDEITLKNKENEFLLLISNALVSAKEKKDLQNVIGDILKQSFHFEASHISLYNSTTKTYRSYAYDAPVYVLNNPIFQNMINSEIPEEESIIDFSHMPIRIDVEQLLPYGIEWVNHIYSMGFKEFIRVKLTDGQKQLGVLILLSTQKDRFDGNSVSLLQRVSFKISKGLANILANEEISRRDKENETLLSVSHAIGSIRDKQDLVNNINFILKRLLHYSDIAISIYNLPKKNYQVFLNDCPTMREASDFKEVANATHPINDGIHDKAIETEDAVILSHGELTEMNQPHINFMLYAGIRELAVIQLRNRNEIIGGMVLMSKETGCFARQDKDLIKRTSLHLATAVSNIIANEKIEGQLEQINKYKEQLEFEKRYLQEEVRSNFRYEDIVGIGDEMQQVFQLIDQVAMANTSVLLLGETGTGKELVARAIHNASSRRDKLMVKVNCAALPPGLIESELFGHERGSFTGAIDRRVGKFELANKGTLFLDEIGEMPLDLQVKLLRAIQEKEIERLGGKTVIKTDVRIIAATNRHLEKEVAEGRFRADLYYRLNVFPVELPPLRSRKKDIPSLALYFMDKYARSNGKKINNISGRAMNSLIAYDWPGNVRELEHVIERSTLLTQGNIIKDVHLPNTHFDSQANQTSVIKTLEEHEKDYIINILNKCNGKVAGIDGAAEKLGLHPSTLNSKIRKLGITKSAVHSG